MKLSNLMRCASAFLMLLLTSLSLPSKATADPQVKLRADLGQSTMVEGRTQKTYLRISLEGLPIATQEHRTPVNVALVLDRSGSMRGQKLEQAKEAAVMAINRLADADIASIVVYDHNVDTLIPATRITEHHAITEKIRSLRHGGRTALYAGVNQGVRELEKFLDPEIVNRVILLSDGIANVGPSSPAALGELGRKLAGKGISVTTIGLGLGYNEDLMSKLAFNSDGNHAFVERPDDLVRIFNEEFNDVLSVVAQNIEIEIIFRPGFRPIRSIGREGRIEDHKITYKLNQLYGAQEKQFVLEVEVNGDEAVGEPNVADVNVRYLNLATKAQSKLTEDIALRFSKSKEEAEKSLNKAVLEQATSQIAVERNERAVILRDKGDVDGARKLLEQTADYIKRQSLRLGGSKTLGDLENANRTDANNLAKPNWNKYRKGMRAKQHKDKTQQAY